ncbi:MAG: yrrB 4 [Fibrobacteria bacterium]|jgi:Flp pilus assembly protein TadD|nr:yrrB 4 [Fibrobacteria bacterium]
MAVLAPSRPLWILGPKRDLLFFILPPLFIVPLILVLKRAIPAETLALYILGLGGFGHHLPGFIRAYADPGLFRRYKLRFTLVPALLLLVCALYSYLDLNALVLATVAWGTWHGAMQINGFARIYDARVGSIAPATARLDAWMCIAWFGFAILCSPAKQFSLVTPFYLSGGPLIPPAAFGIVRFAWGAATAAITLGFALNAFRQWRAGNPPNPVKLLVMAASFAFWWYCTAWPESLILGVLMWEIFHDIQYNALVWRFQRQRVDDGLGAGRIERALFRPGWGRLALYAALIGVYGYIGVAASFSDINTPEKMLLGASGPQWLLRITLASALLHFYYDGFIWRIRRQEIRQGLGLSGKESAPVRPERDAFGAHGWKWILFLLPVGYLGWAQYEKWGPAFEAQVVNLSRALPGSWISHFLAGTYYKGQGQMAEAEEQYRQVTRFNPEFPQGHVFLGDLLYRRGALDEAAAEYERALKLDSSDASVRRNLGFLYLSLGRAYSATRQFEALLARDPRDVEAGFGLANALLRQNLLREAADRADKVLRLQPGHSGALNILGMAHQLRGERDSARFYYARALLADSSNASALQNLRDLAATPGASGNRSK